MSENSLEFQPMPGINPKEDGVRNSFRVPASNRDNIQVVFYKEPYTVVDISNRGIAIKADTCYQFEAGQLIENAELMLDGQQINGLTAKVVHCSIRDTGSLQFGLAWIGMSDDDKSQLNTFITKIKSKYLSEN